MAGASACAFRLPAVLASVGAASDLMVAAGAATGTATGTATGAAGAVEQREQPRPTGAGSCRCHARRVRDQELRNLVMKRALAGDAHGCIHGFDGRRQIERRGRASYDLARETGRAQSLKTGAPWARQKLKNLNCAGSASPSGYHGIWGNDTVTERSRGRRLSARYARYALIYMCY